MAVEQLPNGPVDPKDQVRACWQIVYRERGVMPQSGREIAAMRTITKLTTQDPSLKNVFLDMNNPAVNGKRGSR